MNPPETIARLHRPADGSTWMAGVACWLWGVVALGVAAALLVITAIDRSRIDREPQPLLFRLLLEGVMTLHFNRLDWLPGMNFDPRRLGHFLNRDFDDAYLVGSATVALAFAAACWLAGSGLGRGERWARAFVLALTWGSSAAIVAYGLESMVIGAPLGGLAVLAAASLVPAALAVDLTRRDDQPGSSPSRRRVPLTRSCLLLILSADAMLIVPLGALAWVHMGMLARSAWLGWVS
jgi:hypothetical protein